MTEKRFDYTAYDDGTESIYDREKDEYYFDMQLSNIEELLNDLEEENKQLKKEMGDLGTAHAEEINKIEDEFDEEILKLEKENEQLKKRLIICQDKVKGLMK